MNRYGALIIGSCLAFCSTQVLAAPTDANANATAGADQDQATVQAGTSSATDKAETKSSSTAQAADDKSADTGKQTESEAITRAESVAAQAKEMRKQARNALKQKETDASTEKNLEEVFEAAQKQYSLLKSGDMDMTLSGSYTYYSSDSIDLHFNNSGSIDRFRILSNAQHSFGMGLSFDYGIWDNLTFNTYLPVVYQYDTEKNVKKAALGDISLGLRYQPFPVVRGGVNTTLYTTLSTATGDSVYEANPNTEVSSGKGYYSLGGGVSMSKVIDPVVLYGSVGYTFAFNATGLNQPQSGRVLKKVEPGDSLSFAFGMAYALSYDVSLSGSYQQSYNFPSRYHFNDGAVIESQDATSAAVNLSLGLRTSDNNIVNLSFGFGLTKNSPDVMLGFSLPINITGFKTGS